MQIYLCRCKRWQLVLLVACNGGIPCIINETDDDFEYLNQLDQLTEYRTFFPHGFSHTHHYMNSFVFQRNIKYFIQQRTKETGGGRKRLLRYALNAYARVAYVAFKWIWLINWMKTTSEIIKSVYVLKRDEKLAIEVASVCIITYVSLTM